MNGREIRRKELPKAELGVRFPAVSGVHPGPRGRDCASGRPCAPFWPLATSSWTGLRLLRVVRHPTPGQRRPTDPERYLPAHVPQAPVPIRGHGPSRASSSAAAAAATSCWSAAARPSPYEVPTR